MRSHFEGPVTTGTIWEGAAANFGYTVLSQTQEIVQAGAAAVDAKFQLPANAQILNFYVDQEVTWDSATSATLTIGITSGGTEYVTSVNLKTLSGRGSVTFTAAQLIAMQNIGTNINVFATATAVGATSAGKTFVTVVYAQK